MSSFFRPSLLSRRSVPSIDYIIKHHSENKADNLIKENEKLINEEKLATHSENCFSCNNLELDDENTTENPDLISGIEKE